MLKLRLPLGACGLVTLQQLQRQADQVVKVHCLKSLQAFLVAAHHARGHLFVGVGCCGLGAIGVQALVLPQADGPLPALGQCVVAGAAGVAHDTQHVVTVKDTELFFEAQRPAVTAQDAHAQ